MNFRIPQVGELSVVSGGVFSSPLTIQFMKVPVYLGYIVNAECTLQLTIFEGPTLKHPVIKYVEDVTRKTKAMGQNFEDTYRMFADSHNIAPRDGKLPRKVHSSDNNQFFTDDEKRDLIAAADVWDKIKHSLYKQAEDVLQKHGFNVTKYDPVVICTEDPTNPSASFLRENDHQGNLYGWRLAACSKGGLFIVCRELFLRTIKHISRSDVKYAALRLD